uniref:BBP1_C domain-containing protein n=1 Tax=Strongyloides papillosus TaxID=174720 RepID=A0A0N5CHR4_STREA
MSSRNSIVISSFPEDEEQNSFSWLIGKIFCRPYWKESDGYTKTNTFITNSDSGYFDWTDSGVSRSSSFHLPTSRVWSDYDLCQGDDEDQENNNFMKQNSFEYIKPSTVVTKSTSILSSIFDYISNPFSIESPKRSNSLYQFNNTSKGFSNYSIDDNNNNNSVTGSLTKTFPTDCTSTLDKMSSIRKASETQISPVAEQHYRRLLSQISLSNCSLVRENEAMKERLQELESLLDDHMKHLKSIYFTLYKNGYSKLQFPDGDEVNLAQFEGLLLNFKKSPQPEEGYTEENNLDKHLVVEASSTGESSYSSRKLTNSFTELPPVKESYSE